MGTQDSERSAVQEPWRWRTAREAPGSRGKGGGTVTVSRRSPPAFQSCGPQQSPGQLLSGLCSESPGLLAWAPDRRMDGRAGLAGTRGTWCGSQAELLKWAPEGRTAGLTLESPLMARYCSRHPWSLRHLDSGERSSTSCLEVLSHLPSRGLPASFFGAAAVLVL